jgi:hypothetical protein
VSRKAQQVSNTDACPNLPCKDVDLCTTRKNFLAALAALLQQKKWSAPTAIIPPYGLSLALARHNGFVAQEEQQGDGISDG